MKSIVLSGSMKVKEEILKVGKELEKMDFVYYFQMSI